MNNLFKIPCSTAKSLFDELKQSNNDEINERDLNNCKHRFGNCLKENIENFLDN